MTESDRMPPLAAASGPGRPASSGPFRGRTPVDIVREGYARFARRDYRGLFELFSPEIEFWQTPQLPWGGRYRGRDGARDYFANVHRYSPGKIVPIVYVPAGDEVVVIGRARGKVRATGNPFDVGLVHVWTIREGRAVSCAVFVDTPEMRRALGSTPTRPGLESELPAP